jgi:hypothetical protein
MKKLRIALAAAALAQLSYCAGTAPAFAQTAPEAAPQTAGPGPILPPTKTPPVVLWIYEKFLPVQEGETIIQDPRAIGHHMPTDGISPDPRENLKDTRTWA